ncbi:hypothetical protein SAMN05445756_1873 [Kytococcus aerolatus]|uniref:Uncharacterized protein n=1 Tax=Kytococcus aerolatus TaxID=592308 RepID=A0A212U314_9MICO|nr:hypothetical protein [Kytococcus aerolatus]SNC72514.1 hypothetical protein SAMN05445756_1873 [Kytococcus aerolatus]
MVDPDASRPAHGVLWFSGDPEGVAAWLVGGVVSAEVVALDGWTLVRPLELPAGLGPYGDAVGLILSRVVPDEHRPVVALTEREGVVVVAAADQPGDEVHWVAVQPGVGPRSLGELPTCGPRYMTAAAGVPEQADELAALIARRRAVGSGAGELGMRLAMVLGLPEPAVARRQVEFSHGLVVEPDPREVQRFKQVLSDRLVERDEEAGR